MITPMLEKKSQGGTGKHLYANKEPRFPHFSFSRNGETPCRVFKGLKTIIPIKPPMKSSICESKLITQLAKC